MTMSIKSFLGSSTGLATAIVLASLGALLLWSHTGHVLLAVPYLILLACPLMHVFHRGRHHDDGRPRGTHDRDVSSKKETRS